MHSRSIIIKTFADILYLSFKLIDHVILFDNVESIYSTKLACLAGSSRGHMSQCPVVVPMVIVEEVTTRG